MHFKLKNLPFCLHFLKNVTWCAGPAVLPLRLSVVHALSEKIPESYPTSVVEGGVLMGALRRLQEAQHDFK